MKIFGRFAAGFSRAFGERLVYQGIRRLCTSLKRPHSRPRAPSRRTRLYPLSLQVMTGRTIKYLTMGWVTANAPEVGSNLWLLLVCLLTIVLGLLLHMITAAGYGLYCVVTPFVKVAQLLVRACAYLGGCRRESQKIVGGARVQQTNRVVISERDTEPSGFTTQGIPD